MTNSPTTASKPTAIVAVSGGIAVYKAVEVVSRLRKADVEVRVLMSTSATEFVTPLTFQAISGHRVNLDMFAQPEADEPDLIYPHLYPAMEADLFVLVPATAHSIARLANGYSETLPEAAAMAFPASGQAFFCPAMNDQMWADERVQDNCTRLQKLGWTQIGPANGVLACGSAGAGRLAEPEDICTILLNQLQHRQSLSGQRVLITSGPTQEPIDPVRYISNGSSGRMGQALALEAARRGAEVDFITGPVAQAYWPLAPNIHLHPVRTAQNMLATAQRLQAKANLVIFAAAVADYAPAEPSAEKQAKSTGPLSLTLTPTPDIAASLKADAPRDQLRIGFALQSGDGRAEAREKLTRKGLDAIVLNHPEAMGAHQASYHLLTREPDACTAWGELSKTECAHRILDWARSQDYSGCEQTEFPSGLDIQQPT